MNDYCMNKVFKRMSTRGRPFDLSGERFGMLSVIDYAGKKGRENLWCCMCDCGQQQTAPASRLIAGKVRSCGCLVSITNTKHGLSHSPEYDCWKNIKSRCYNENNGEYKNYGARGIVMCERWIVSFENFIADMGTRPSPNHSIDRIDVDGNYCKENCRWATLKQQNDNKRQSVIITAFGETLSLTSMAKKHGVSPTTLAYRLRFVSPETALIMPKYKRGAYAQHNA